MPSFEPPIDRNALRADALRVLRANDVGAFIKPSATQYPHQWNWDAAVIALGLSHVDRPRAEQEVRALLRGQWADGMLPHIVYHDGASSYFPTPEFWQTSASPQAPSVATSGIVQPPLLATCVRRMHDHAPDRAASLAFVREVVPDLARWHDWLYHARDPETTGLVAILHPWESGTDNAARFIEPMMRIRPRDVPAYTRGDTAHVAAHQRPVQAEYERFIHLVDCFRTVRYDPERLYATSPFLVQDAFFNAILYRADEDLLALATELGEPTEAIEARLAAMRSAFEDRLWDEECGFYRSYDARHGTWLTESDCAIFLPLFAGLATPERAARLVEDHLLDPDAYAPDAASRYTLPTQAKHNLFYEPQRYWRGPVWVLTNWLVAEGLDRYGYGDLAATLRRDSVALTAAHGFVEYFDPRDGAPCGIPGFSWSAALILDLLARGW